MTLSLGRRLARGDSRAGLFRQAARRAGVLFVLGVLVYADPALDLSRQRILGVLQRIALCYLAAAAIYLTTKLRGQIVWIVALMAVYWLLMAFAPVPGYGPGVWTLRTTSRITSIESFLAPTITFRPRRGTRRASSARCRQSPPACSDCLRATLWACGAVSGSAACAWFGWASSCLRRPRLQRLAADQQEALDRFLHSLHGRPGFRPLRRIPVASGSLLGATEAGR